MKRKILAAASLVLMGLCGCHSDYNRYFYVDREMSVYRCKLNGTNATKPFLTVAEATAVCDALNKALGPNADLPPNETY